MEGIIKKLIYYRDIKFLLRICLLYLRIIYVLKKDNHPVLELIPPVNRDLKKAADIEKITRYKDFCILVFRKLGFKDTCLIRSIIFCSILRSAGMDVRVNFGSMRIDNKLVGHCWLDYNKEEGENYKLVCSYP